jgi:hypothetical protein
MGSPPDSAKAAAMRKNPRVAFEIDTTEWPYKVLSLRGNVTVDLVEGLTAEYVQAAQRYFGPEGGQAWVDQMSGLFKEMARMALRPDWVSILNFESRFPQKVTQAMGAAQN